VNPWFDEACLIPGQDWKREIKKAVENSDVVVACLTHGSVTKTGFVQTEITYALDCADRQPEGSIYLIPARLEECAVPDRLARWHWVDLFEPDGYQKLLTALRSKAVTAKVDEAPAANPVPTSDSGPVAVVQQVRLPGTCIAMTDETDFARDLTQLFEAAAFKITSLPVSDLLTFERFQPSVVLLIRGDNFVERGSSLATLQPKLKEWVARGTTFFATSFVSWETQPSEAFRSLLPFLHGGRKFWEDRSCECSLTSSSVHLMADIEDRDFERGFAVEMSLEYLADTKPGTTVFLTGSPPKNASPHGEFPRLSEMPDLLPILGACKIGAGQCIYFNGLSAGIRKKWHSTRLS
jgi:hypothetical protein